MSALEGVRVLDVTSALSGPVATQILADMGADVIKIEPPTGDSIRNLGPFRNPGMGAMFLHTNRNKRSVVLDLKSSEGKAIFLHLAADSDILVCNTRPKVMRRLGLDYADIQTVNPQIIYVNIVGYGSGSHYSDKPAYDDLIQAAAGIASLHAPSEPSRYSPIALADRVTGMSAANMALGALYYRTKSGIGQHIEVPMFECIASLVMADHMAGLTFQPPLGPPVFRRYSEIRRPFQTQDGFISIMMLTDKQWHRFFKAVGREELMNDKRFNNMSERTKNLDAVYEIVSKIILTRKTTQWINLLESLDLAVAQVETIESLMEHPHLLQTDFFKITEHPSEGIIRTMPKSSSWSVTQPKSARAAPRLGEHTREVLQDVGLSESEIDNLLARSSIKEEQI